MDISKYHGAKGSRRKHKEAKIPKWEVAESFGVHPNTVANWLKSGLLEELSLAGVVRLAAAASLAGGGCVKKGANMMSRMKV